MAVFDVMIPKAHTVDATGMDLLEFPKLNTGLHQVLHCGGRLNLCGRPLLIAGSSSESVSTSRAPVSSCTGGYLSSPATVVRSILPSACSVPSRPSVSMCSNGSYTRRQFKQCLLHSVWVKIPIR
jgi:hypothetical protein